MKLERYHVARMALVLGRCPCSSCRIIRGVALYRVTALRKPPDSPCCIWSPPSPCPQTRSPRGPSPWAHPRPPTA